MASSLDRLEIAAAAAERPPSAGKRILRYLVVASTMLLVPGPLHGQVRLVSPDALSEYEKVRLQLRRHGAREVRGRVVEADSARLVLAAQRKSRVIVPLDVVERAQVLTGPSRWAGAFRGLGIGALTAGAIFKVGADLYYRNDEWNTFGAVFVAAPAGAILGGIIGAGYPIPQWEEVRIDPAVRLDSGEESTLSIHVAVAVG